MRKYELAIVMRPSLKEADRKKLLEDIKGWLGKIKIAKENDWGQKALAYEIKKEEAGHYYMLELEGEEPSYKGNVEERKAGVPADFEQKLIRHDSIIRHLLLRTE